MSKTLRECTDEINERQRLCMVTAELIDIYTLTQDEVMELCCAGVLSPVHYTQWAKAERQGRLTCKLT